MSILDINNIKTQIKSILDAANTATGSPIDLSNNLERRIEQVFKTNPEKLEVDASLYPCVNIYTDDKTISPAGIAKNQLNAKREANLSLMIAGIEYNDNFSDISENPAEEQVEILMENIECVLRGNPTLNGSVTWQFPSTVNYLTVPYDEQVHLRAGVMSLDIKVFY